MRRRRHGIQQLDQRFAAVAGLKRRRRLARAAKTLTRPNEQKPRWATRRGELLLEGTITVKCAAVKGSLDRLIGINSNGNVYPCSTAPLSSAIPLSSPALRSALSLSAQRSRVVLVDQNA